MASNSIISNSVCGLGISGILYYTVAALRVQTVSILWNHFPSGKGVQRIIMRGTREQISLDTRNINIYWSSFKWQLFSKKRWKSSNILDPPYSEQWKINRWHQDQKPRLRKHSRSAVSSWETSASRSRPARYAGMLPSTNTNIWKQVMDHQQCCCECHQCRNWFLRKPQRMSYTDRVTNEEVLRRAETGRKLYVKIREASKILWACHEERQNRKHDNREKRAEKHNVLNILTAKRKYNTNTQHERQKEVQRNDCQCHTAGHLKK